MRQKDSGIAKKWGKRLRRMTQRSLRKSKALELQPNDGVELGKCAGCLLERAAAFVRLH
jgi:hypothetical protein